MAGTPNGSTTCGGTFAPGASDVSLAFTGGAVAAGDACAISVDVTSAVAGSYPNTSGALTSDLPDAPPATATLTVDEAPLVVSMGFSPSTIAQGGVSRLSYDLGNAAAVGATSISLSDTLPADVTVADAPNAATTCAGGVLTAPAGGDTIAFADGAACGGRRLRDFRRCDLRGCGKLPERPGERDLVAGRKHARAGDADGRCGGCAGLYQGVFAGHDRSGRDFQADVHDRQWGQPDRCRVAGLYRRLPGRSCRGRDPQRVDDLRRDICARGVGCLACLHRRRCCGRASCAISVDVQAVGLVGPLENISGALTSDLPDAAPPALATLTVDEAPLVVSMGFSPSTIAQGGVSRLSYDLGNAAAVGATSISLSDTLPADVTVADAPNAATTCAGGVLTAPAGGDTNLVFRRRCCGRGRLRDFRRCDLRGCGKL